jgi:FixJ family two-component response regulator
MQISKQNLALIMIHIIDDDPNVRDGFSLLLKSAGFKCHSFESAEKFLEYSEKHHNIDLLILDIHLTGMNGIELLEKLDGKKNRLPVVIVTAYDDQATRTAAKNYGALAYFRKPVDSEALLDIIKYNLNINTNYQIN